MDPEETFIHVQERFLQMFTPRVRVALEYIYLLIAITLFCFLVVMHANYVQQPGCSSEFSGVETTEAQLFQIKITSVGLWSQDASESIPINIHEQETSRENIQVPKVDGDGLKYLASKFWSSLVGLGARRSKLVLKSWKADNEIIGHQADISTGSSSSKPNMDEAETHTGFHISTRESFKAALIHYCCKWRSRLSFFWGYTKQFLGSFHHIQNLSGMDLHIDIPKWLHLLHLDRLNLFAVQWLEKRSKAFEPTYLYTLEKGYFMLPEEARSQHNIHTINISVSARHSCFGNRALLYTFVEDLKHLKRLGLRWQQLLINRLVGYDTILMNSLLSSPGQGYLYNYQTKEFYNLSYAHEPAEGPARFGDYLVTKCGVLMMSLFVFFTTTMSVSFTLRETQTRMLKFTVQLQHHARHQLPTFQLIFVHVIESLVFVPIMIGILFFLFEFYDDQLLAFMVLILVWLCELFTLISVRTPISMKYFPRFFLLYFLVFHIYFFSYAYGFSYLAFCTTSAFMQHLILYFWNRFEVPSLQRFVQNRQSQLQHHPDFHITSSTILASTLHITRLNMRNPGPDNTDPGSGPGLAHGADQARFPNGVQATGLQEPSETGNPERLGSPIQFPDPPDLQQTEAAPNPGAMNSSFSSLLLWILGGASSEGLNSFLSMFRDIRDQGQVYEESPQQNAEAQNSQ